MVEKKAVSKAAALDMKMVACLEPSKVELLVMRPVVLMVEQ